MVLEGEHCQQCENNSFPGPVGPQPAASVPHCVHGGARVGTQQGTHTKPLQNPCSPDYARLTG